MRKHVANRPCACEHDPEQHERKARPCPEFSDCATRHFIVVCRVCESNEKKESK